MTDWEEKTCQLCAGVAGLYHRREKLILVGETEKAEAVNEPIHLLIKDLKGWLLKHE